MAVKVNTNYKETFKGPCPLQQKIPLAKNFNELGQAHVDLIMTGKDKSLAKAAKDQAFYNASVITRILEILTEKHG